MLMCYLMIHIWLKFDRSLYGSDLSTLCVEQNLPASLILFIVENSGYSGPTKGSKLIGEFAQEFCSNYSKLILSEGNSLITGYQP